MKCIEQYKYCVLKYRNEPTKNNVITLNVAYCFNCFIKPFTHNSEERLKCLSVSKYDARFLGHFCVKPVGL